MYIYLVIVAIATTITTCAIGIVYLLSSLIDDFKYYQRTIRKKRRKNNEKN